MWLKEGGLSWSPPLYGAVVAGPCQNKTSLSACHGCLFVFLVSRPAGEFPTGRLMHVFSSVCGSTSWSGVQPFYPPPAVTSYLDGCHGGDPLSFYPHPRKYADGMFRPCHGRQFNKVYILPKLCLCLFSLEFRAEEPNPSCPTPSPGHFPLPWRALQRHV